MLLNAFNFRSSAICRAFRAIVERSLDFFRSSKCPQLNKLVKSCPIRHFLSSSALGAAFLRTAFSANYSHKRASPKGFRQMFHLSGGLSFSEFEFQKKKIQFQEPQRAPLMACRLSADDLCPPDKFCIRNDPLAAGERPSLAPLRSNPPQQQRGPPAGSSRTPARLVASASCNKINRKWS